tara:strand:+ start:1271 stop:1810 length:540 start_codon:yes stop_codon:yes gene_type:complete
MATILDVIQGLQQAASNAYDGAVDSDGELVEAGLQREEGNPLIDKRVIDGFNVSFYADRMCLSYHSEVQLKEVYAGGFEDQIEQTLSEVIKFLKKEYRKVTGNSVTLESLEEADIRVENSSRVRSWVTAKKHYRIGGIDNMDEIKTPSEDRLDAGWQKFLNQGGWKGKRPKNDSRKKET